MTSYQDILDAADVPDYGESLRRIKSIAARTLTEADRSARLLATEHFNHSYLPDFIMQWKNRPDRLVFLRASSYAEEIEEDVVRLADRRPLFLQLSQFRPYDDRPVRSAIDSLDRSAGESKSLVTSIPAIGYLDDSPRTGQMLSSFVMRGGRGVVEDDEAVSISERVESGFDGAMNSDRASTADAIEAVEGVLDPNATAEFTHLFEAAWISGGARAVDFPGGVTSIGEDLSSDLLRKLLDIVSESMTDFWEQIGNAVTLESFRQLHLVGDQPQLQRIMKNAIRRLRANRSSVRKTQRADQREDPFIWQVDEGFPSLRGGGYQAWIGTSSPPVPSKDGGQDLYSIDEAVTLSQLSSRAENANLTISDINVSDAADISVRFTSPGDRDVATSALVERVTDSLGTLVRVNDVVARINGKAVRVEFTHGAAKGRTNAIVPASGLIWNAWNLLAETKEERRTELEQVLGRGDEHPDLDADNSESAASEVADSAEAVHGEGIEPSSD